MGDITWTLPRSDVTSNHKFHVVLNLIEAGIKLFLHQRNQIPVPVEHLSRQNETKIRATHPPPRPTKAEVLIDENVVNSLNGITRSTNTLPPDYVDPRIRLQNLLGSRRKKMLDKCRTDTEKNRIAKETYAYSSIMNLLQTMKDEFVSLPVPPQAVALVLGSSLAFPKEVVVFDFKDVDFHETRELLSSDISVLCRSYYKAIIMSDAFVELTDTPLFATKASIYLFVKEKLPSRVDQKLLLIDSVQWIGELFNPENSKMKTFRQTQGPHSKNIRKKRNIIRICINDIGGGNVLKGDSAMRADISISEDKVFIPPNNSFCYQIPCFFKGFHCKKKQ